MKDLFGEIIDDDSDGAAMESDIDLIMGGGNKAKTNTASFYDQGPVEKSYTLTIICDPEESGIDKKYLEYQKFMIEHHAHSGYTKPKRLVLNASNQGSRGPSMMTAAEDEKFRKNT